MFRFSDDQDGEEQAIRYFQQMAGASRQFSHCSPKDSNEREKVTLTKLERARPSLRYKPKKFLSCRSFLT